MNKRFHWLILNLASLIFFAFTQQTENSLTPYSWPQIEPLPTPLVDYHCVTEEGAALGRRLFYDAQLSSKHLTSCASCHRQEFAFGDTAHLSLGDQSLADRHTPALFNLMWQEQFSWDARADDLKEQTSIALHREMNINWEESLAYLNESSLYQIELNSYANGRKVDSSLVIDALVEFQMTLVSNRSKYDEVILGLNYFDSLETAGFALFNDQSISGCLNCHPADGTTLGSLYQLSDNGLQVVETAYQDEGYGAVNGESKSMGRFKVPSVRNLAFSAPYMHDGSLNELEDVLEFYSQHINATPNRDPRILFRNGKGALMSEDDILAITAFLLTLSDSAFIVEAKFSDPWR